MKIAMVAPHYAPEVGGLESSVRLLAEWLAARGHAVSVRTSARATDGRTLGAQDSLGGVDIRRYPLRMDLGYFRSIFCPDLGDSDLVHLHGYGVLTNDLVARRARVPVVYSLHHGVSMPHPTAFTRLERSLYDRIVGMRTVRRVGAVVVANRLDLTWLESRRTPAGRAIVLPTPLPDDAFSPGDPTQARARFGDVPFVLFLGRLHQEKGVLDLVRAMPLLPRLQAWFAGPDAGAGPEMRSEAERLGVGGRVRLLGFVPEADKRDLLSACACLVLPSIHEAQGLVLAEAWAQRRPVVAARAGALPEWVEDGSNGFLVPPGNPAALAGAIARLEADPRQASAMGARGRERAETLRMDRLGPEYEALYARVSSAARGTGPQASGR